ncbi:hypothetical protein [Thioalkalivibrio sp. K90mix]|uniref:hypothetical protein n=1 Tax=Thioalkalivibrio sp. (strain K90mix) TaxID=396595 RepID=UPI0011D0CEA6|nr:hypothetical protein [Thioalkalivibrio sp. K90mix]
MTAATAAKLKAEAAARGCTIGEALEALLDASTTTRGQAAPAPTGAAETAAPDQAGPEAPNGPEKATSAASTSQAPTRRTRRRCPRSGDEGVETRRAGSWDRFTVLVDGVEVGTVTKARSGWRGETTDGRQVEGRVATAAVNRVLKAAHAAGLLEANTGGA